MRLARAIGRTRKMVAKLVAVLALVRAQAMAAHTQAPTEMSPARIFYGELVAPGEFPFLVSIDDACGGSIIDSSHILTAAHCLLGY